MRATHETNEKQTAAQQVLATPEILEIILIELSHCDLLTRAQRVNRAFHGAISTSPQIQKTLFFLPATDGSVSGPCPFLRGSRGGCFKIFIDRRPNQYSRSLQQERQLVSQGKNHYRFEWEYNTDLKRYDRWNATPERNAAVLRKDASWRKMLISQPPITELNLNGQHDWLVSDKWLRMEALDSGIGNTYSRFTISRDGKGTLTTTNDHGG